MLQHIILVVILACAVFYASWRIYRILTQSADPCEGCSGCELKKKNREKFCQSKK